MSFICLYTSDSSTPPTYYYQMTTWPSGLRRVTRNHFSSGGVGSNPAVVVFCSTFLYTLIPTKKWFHPDSNWGPENQNLICCPYTMEPFYTTFISLYLFPMWPLYLFILFPYVLPFKKRAQSDSNQWPRELQSYALPLSYAPSYFSFMFSPFCVFLSCLPLKKTPPVGLEPTTLRLKAARSTDWARKALAYLSLFSLLCTFYICYFFFLYNIISLLYYPNILSEYYPNITRLFLTLLIFFPPDYFLPILYHACCPHHLLLPLSDVLSAFF